MKRMGMVVAMLLAVGLGGCALGATGPTVHNTSPCTRGLWCGRDGAEVNAPSQETLKAVREGVSAVVVGGSLFLLGTFVLKGGGS